MPRSFTTLTHTFQRFLASEQVGGALLALGTLISLALANSAFGATWREFWHQPLGPLSIELWVNDALMAVFFLLIGLELERELYVGELSNLRQALLPIIAALGGLATPALLHFALNGGTSAQAGFGIPMATDIAFALGALALLGNRVPNALKVFVVAFAVMDDLGAILVIAAFYTTNLSFLYLAGSLTVWLGLVVLNRRFRIMALWPYLLGGVLMWVTMLKSGVHATLAGVLLAFAIPFTHRDPRRESPSLRVEHALHRPVALLILPIFALANTGIPINMARLLELGSSNSLGIMLGLLCGKPLGIVLACAAAVALKLCRLPDSVGWRHIVGAGILGGIGFTMSIFITNLAFADQAAVIGSSKLAVLIASLCAGIVGVLWLMRNDRAGRPAA